MAFFAIMNKRRRAILLQNDEVRDEEGWRVIIKVWQVPRGKTNPDGVDYSLALISPTGERVVGYDNHWPKGHHRHFLGQESSYSYKGIETLILDFKNDIGLAKRKRK